MATKKTTKKALKDARPKQGELAGTTVEASKNPVHIRKHRHRYREKICEFCGIIYRKEGKRFCSSSCSFRHWFATRTPLQLAEIVNRAAEGRAYKINERENYFAKENASPCVDYLDDNQEIDNGDTWESVGDW